MPRSGLQQDVINMYRRGVRMTYAKPKQVRPAFLMNLRYGFHNPPLGPRDYTAIEHQLRRMDRTLEMLETGNVQRVNVTPAMEDWWTQELIKVRMASKAPSASSSSSTSTGGKQAKSATDKAREGMPHDGSVTARGDSERSGTQWGGTLPGHGGT